MIYTFIPHVGHFIYMTSNDKAILMSSNFCNVTAPFTNLPHKTLCDMCHKSSVHTDIGTVSLMSTGISPIYWSLCIGTYV